MRTTFVQCITVLQWCIVFLVVSIGSCTKEKTPKPLTASFQIKEVIWDPDFLAKETYDTDSISTAEVEFVAAELEDSTVSYKWNIGTDARIFTQRKFTLNFSTATTDKIDVSLTVQKKDVTGRLIEKKSFTRTFFLNRRPQIEGHFQGFFEGISQKANVYIKGHDFANPGYFNSNGILVTSDIVKFDTLFSPCGWNEHVVLNRKIYFDNSTTFNEQANPRLMFPKGSMSLDKDYRTLTLDLILKEVATGQMTSMKFKGSKVNK